jgi:hypothetical protein
MHHDHDIPFQFMKALASILLLILLDATSLHADPKAVATRIKGDWNAETGVWHKRLGPVDAAALAELAGDPAVKTIHLDGVKLDLAAVQALGTAKTLKTLLIVHTDVGDLAMLRELAKMQSLTDIHVGSSTFGDEGLKILCGLKNLKSLRLRHVTRDPANPITAAGVKAVADAYPNLEVFYINLHQMEDAMIPELARMPKLKQLMLEWVSPSFLAKVKKVLPKTNVTHTGGKIAPEKEDVEATKLFRGGAKPE